MSLKALILFNNRQCFPFHTLQNKMSFVKNARLLAARGARLAQNRSYSDEMKLTFAAANKTFFDAAEVRQIDVPSFSGSFGILAKHVPTLGKYCR